MTEQLKVGVSGALFPGRSVHTRTLLRALTIAINAFPETRNLSFEFADDGADAATARSVARRFVGSGVDAVLGPFASECLIGAIDLYAEAGIPLVTPAATAWIGGGYGNLFRVCPSDRQIAACLAGRAKARDFRHVAVFGDDSSHSGRLRRLIGLELDDAAIGYAGGVEGTTDALIYTGRFTSSREWLRSIRAAGLRLPVLMTDDAAMPELTDGVDGPGDLEVIGFPAASQIPEARQVSAIYRRLYREEPPIYFAEVIAAALVISQAGRRRRTLLDSLLNDMFETPLGPIAFVDGERRDGACMAWTVDASNRLRPDPAVPLTAPGIPSAGAAGPGPTRIDSGREVSDVRKRAV